MSDGVMITLIICGTLITIVGLSVLSERKKQKKIDEITNKLFNKKED